MSDRQKRYLTSDLAGEVQVPRTTINDWLSRYSAFLDFEMHGKRRLYSVRSLAVLRDIAAMREAGKSAFEIESELTRRYGVQPEVASEPAGMPPPAAAPEPADQAERTELARLEEDQLARFLGRLEEQEQSRQQVSRKFWRLFFFFCLILLLLLFSALGLTGYLLLGKLSESRAAGEAGIKQINAEVEAVATALQAVRQDQGGVVETGRRQQSELEKISVLLDRTRQDYADNIAKLTAELERQRLAATKERRELSEEIRSRYEAEMIQLKEDFAERQLDLLKKLEEETSRRQKLEALAEKTALKEEIPPANPATNLPTEPEKPLPIQPAEQAEPENHEGTK